MYLKKRSLDYHPINFCFKRLPSSVFDGYQQTNSSHQMEFDIIEEETISRVLEHYNEHVDKFNKKVINRLLKEHQLFMEVFYNFELMVEHHMEIEDS